MGNIVNTRMLQLKSLNSFMKSLGYFPIGKGYITDAGDLKRFEVLSFNTAVILHNAYMEDWEYDGWKHFYFKPKYHFDGTIDLKTGLSFPVQDVLRARASRYVERLKMQYSRKKGVIVQEHRVTLTHPAFELMIGE